MIWAYLVLMLGDWNFGLIFDEVAATIGVGKKQNMEKVGQLEPTPKIRLKCSNLYHLNQGLLIIDEIIICSLMCIATTIMLFPDIDLNDCSQL